MMVFYESAMLQQCQTEKEMEWEEGDLNYQEITLGHTNIHTAYILTESEPNLKCVKQKNPKK